MRKSIRSTRCTAATFLAVAAMLAAGPARAQIAGNGPGANPSTNPGASGTGGIPAGTALVSPGQGGVAGTGLGRLTPGADAPGTGMSVKGPPGQAIDPNLMMK